MQLNRQSLLVALSLSSLVSASPLEASSSLQPREEPQNALVVSHIAPECAGRSFRPKKPISISVDRCFTTPGFGLVIKRPAVCANGTRAKWARYTDGKCMGGGKIDPQLGLKEIEDKDLDTCLETHCIDNEDGEEGARKKVSSSAFWCDGVTPPTFSKPGNDKENSKVRKGTVSESVCAREGAPFWDHPAPDTCVKLRTGKLSVIRLAVCEDGKNSTLALYREKGCGGGKAMFMDIDADHIEKCLDVGGSESFAFYCTGEGIQRPGLPIRNNGGSLWHFLFMLTLIIMMFILMLVLSIWAWVRRYGDGVGRLIEIFNGFFKPKDGGIAL